MDMAKLLKSKGLRVTPQRLAILDILRSTKAHPSVETVYDLVRERFPSISFNTVYKTLQSFEDAGLVWKLSIDNLYRYDGNTLPHAHFYCHRCGMVLDVNGELTQRFSEFLEMARKTPGLKVQSMEVNFYGHCPACRY